MEKINKEELMKKLNLTEEELEKIAGGSKTDWDGDCFFNCYIKQELSFDFCLENCS